MIEIKAGGQETTPVPADALAELDASLHQVHLSLKAVMDMLGGCPAHHTISAGALRALLMPVADQVDQAASLAQALAPP